MKKIVITWLGRGLMLLSLAFILWKLWNYRLNLWSVLTWKDASLYLLSALVWGAVMFRAVPVCFYWIVSLFTQKRCPYSKVRYIYCKSNLYKYLPGNVMHYIGRNQLAAEEDVQHKEVIFSSMAEVAITCLAAVFIVSAFSLPYTVRWITEKMHLPNGFLLTFLLILAAILFGTGVLLGKKITNFSAPFRLLLSKHGLPVIARSLAVWIAVLLLNACLFILPLYLLGGVIPIKKIPIAVGLCTLAWLVGFITPGAPGGLGIREAILDYFFSAYLPTEVTVVGVVIFRVITTLGDFFAYLFALGSAAGSGKIDKAGKGR